MRWSVPGAQGLIEVARTCFEGAVWPDPPPGFARIGPERPMRQVLEGAFPLPGTPRVVVKWSRPVTAADEVSRYLRGGKGVREGRVLEVLAERGIPAPRPLAFTDEGVDILVLERIAGLRPLPASAEADAALVDAVATLLGKAFRAGLRHGDIHRGNLAIVDGNVTLIDLGSTRIARGGGLVREMAKAASGLTAGLSRSRRLAAIRAYLRAADDHEPSRRRMRDVAWKVDHWARLTTRRYRRGRDRRATRTGRHYEVFRDGRDSGIRRRETPDVWKTSCPNWVREAPRGSVPLKSDGRVALATLPPGDDQVVLKRYAPVAPGRLPRAVRAFRLSAILEHRGIEAPRALLAYATRAGSVLVSEHVEGTDLHQFMADGLDGMLGDLDPAERRNLFDALGRFLRRMHDEELSHRDLKAPNLLVVSAEDGRFAIADLDGARRRVVPWRRRARDLARLDASLGADRLDRARVLRAYWRGGPRPPVARGTFAAWIADRVRWKLKRPGYRLSSASSASVTRDSTP